MKIDSATPIEILCTNENKTVLFACKELKRYLGKALQTELDVYIRSHDRPETEVPASSFRVVLAGGGQGKFEDD